MSRSPRRVCIVGAGMGGLAAAMLLAAKGLEVVVLERAEAPGGKTRAWPAANGITLLPVFEALFAAAGVNLAEQITLTRQGLLARHHWSDGATLDIVDGRAANADAVGRFAGAAAARGYADFAARAARYFEALEAPFILAQKPGALALSANAGLARRLGLSALAPLWEGLREHFAEPRLCQVFGRAACYIGASPLLAPATLMMISHIEQLGVWQPRGGIGAVVAAMAGVARAQGASLRLGAEVADLRIEAGRARGVVLRGGEVVAADAVIGNADVAAIAAGRLGAAAARVVPVLPAGKRSFSAITWALPAAARPAQSLFLPDDPTAEFSELHFRARLPAQPSLQLATADEGATAMVLAPSRADSRPLSPDAIAACGRAASALMARSGLTLNLEDTVPTTPDDFAQAYPGTGGALYGQAVHGWSASFGRPSATTKLPGFYLCGGGTHPGAGVAMAAISGRLAAERVLEQRA